MIRRDSILILSEIIMGDRVVIFFVNETQNRNSIHSEYRTQAIQYLLTPTPNFSGTHKQDDKSNRYTNKHLHSNTKAGCFRVQIHEENYGHRIGTNNHDDETVSQKRPLPLLLSNSIPIPCGHNSLSRNPWLYGTKAVSLLCRRLPGR